VAGSFDVPVTHCAPLFGIAQALTRQTMAGDVCGTNECVDLTTAIRMYTIHGAFVSFEEGFKGRIEVGKAGRSCPPRGRSQPGLVERLRDVGIVMMVVGGEVVYGA
jgi:predicted amidohydrolase YtcJ